MEHLTTDTQMKLYRGTVLTILEKSGKDLDIDVQVKLPVYDYAFSLQQQLHIIIVSNYLIIFCNVIVVLY